MPSTHLSASPGVGYAAAMKVLIVDDDSDFLTFTTIAMEAAGISYETAASAEDCLALMTERTPGAFDLILLDVEMPGASGTDLLMKLREHGDQIPVIFVSGRGRTEDRVHGLRLGADDYIVKPVEYEELIARMEAVLRRRASLAPIKWGDLSFDLARRSVARAGKAMNSSPREYDLLLTLARAQGEVVTRKNLLRDVWDIEFDPGTNVLDVHIGRVRKKLQFAGTPLIETVRGEGYRLERRST